MEVVYDRQNTERDGVFMNSKLKLFKDLFKEIDTDGYNKVINTVHVLDSILYEEQSFDKLVVIYKQNQKDTYLSFDHSLSYEVRNAYKEIFEKDISSYIEFIKDEELSKYESIHDYFRVKDMEHEKK